MVKREVGLLKEVNFLRVCALLHDIGKIECWANEKPWSSHIFYTQKFVRSCLGEEFAFSAMRHHSGRSYSPDTFPQTIFEKIIAFADDLAAGADRREETIPSGPKPMFPLALTHVLSKGDIARRSSEKAYLAYTSKVLLDNLMKPSSDFSKDPGKAYFEIFKVLEDSDLKFVPADTRRPVNDVSLWDHLKLTAAFSTCIFLGDGYKSDAPEKYDFTLISGDADRIGSFINVSSRLPDLYARSDMIKGATDAASDAVSDILGPECVLYAAGGSFLALSPISLADAALKKAEEAFEDATRKKVTVTTSMVHSNGSEIRSLFGEVWIKAQREMSAKKGERIFLPEVSADEGVDVCDVCRSLPWKHEDATKILKIDASPRSERLCNFCWDMREYGRKEKHIELDKLGEKSGYVGLLKADGDDMGVILGGRKFGDFGKANTPSRLSALSSLIHSTCEKEFGKVIRDHGGECVYSGGDDLLALVPGERSLDAAKAVYSKFNGSMAEQGTMSVGVAIFRYDLPIYAALEVAGYLLSKAKDEGKNKIAFAVIGGTGVTFSELKDHVKARGWNELDAILNVVDFMRGGGVASSQIRRIAGASVKDVEKAEVLIKYSMGRKIIGWSEGKRLLSHLETGLLGDAFTIYNLFKGVEK